MPMAAYPKLATATFSIESLGRATLAVNALSFSAKQTLADAIHAEQPNLLYAVLVLQRFGATMPQIEIVLELLFVGRWCTDTRRARPVGCRVPADESIPLHAEQVQRRTPAPHSEDEIRGNELGAV